MLKCFNKCSNNVSKGCSVCNDITSVSADLAFPIILWSEGKHSFLNAIVFNAPHYSCKYLFGMLHRNIRFWLSQYIVCVFPTTLWPAFFFVAPIKFVLVSRVTRMTIHKWNKKIDLYVVFIHASTRRCKHVWMQIKVLSRQKFLFCRLNAIKNAPLNLWTSDFLTILNIVERLMRCFVDSL